MSRNKTEAYGIACMLIATGFIAGSTMAAKILGSDTPALHPFQISAGRFFFAFCALIVASLWLRPKFEHPNMRLHVGRALFGWLGVTAMFAAASQIPLADATSISFLNPVIAMILAYLILGEKVGPIRWTAAGFAFLGVILLIKPGSSAFHPAALIALAAACFMGMEITIIKKLTGSERPLQILIINNALGALMACTAAYFVWISPSLTQLALMAAVGFLMVTAQAFFIQSMRSGEASLMVPFSYATLLFAGLYDLILFDVIPDHLSLMGAAIILASGVVLAVREGRKSRL